MTVKYLMFFFFFGLFLLPLHSGAKTLEDVIDEVLNGGPENGVDLSRANPDYDYYFVHHIEFRDREDAAFSNYLDRAAKFIQITPYLLAFMYYWGNQTEEVPIERYTTLKHIYLFNLSVINTSLSYHYVYLSKTWPQRNMPVPFVLDVVNHEDSSLESNQTKHHFFWIGNREFKITSGFLTKRRF